MEKINIILDALKEDVRLWNEEKTEFNQRMLFDLVDKTDGTVIDLLLQKDETREKFFVKIRDVYVFKTNEFKFFMEENKVNNSYTRYKNIIGLSDGLEFIKSSGNVVLDFPFKDCILEGGQTAEDGMDTYFEYDEKVTKTQEKKGYKDESYNEKQSKRKEVFFNQVLAQDEIDRLLDDKAFVNWKRFTKDGTKEVTEIKRDENGIIRENFIIKGNNLLALHSLNSQFSGEVKLIYIDPPYNTGNDSFGYNDNFSHATWLTFMRNRLQIAYQLLSDKGAIFIQIDHHELAYLSVIMDEIFGKSNKVQIISVKTASTSGFKAVNPGPIDVTEYILIYTKNKPSDVFKKGYVEVGYHKNYNLFLDKKQTDNVKKWTFTPVKEKAILTAGFKNEKEVKVRFGEATKPYIEQLISDFAFNNCESIVSIRDLHKPTDKVKELQEQSRNNGAKIIVYDKVDGEKMYLYKGGVLAFYSNKVNKVDGKKVVTELLSDFWDHISWAGIAKEGGVKLKNGKKPEKLLKQIIDLTTQEKDIVLDFHLGSGTTAAVAHKMNRQYIGIEQLDYKENDSVERLKNVINGDNSGISDYEDVKWQGGGDFIYLELAKWNEKAKEEINKCDSLKELENLFDTLCVKYFLNYNVRVDEFRNKVIKQKEFIALSLDEQKNIFLSMLDLNQMYVQKTEMEDKRYDISKEEQKLTKLFYRGE